MICITTDSLQWLKFRLSRTRERKPRPGPQAPNRELGPGVIVGLGDTNAVAQKDTVPGQRRKAQWV